MGGLGRGGWGSSASKRKHCRVYPGVPQRVACTFCGCAGRLDIDVSYVEDCKRLAKQCKISELIEELEVKCKQVQEFGETLHDAQTPCFTPCCFTRLVSRANPDAILAACML